MDINFDMPSIITKRNVDSEQNPISVKILETKQVMDNHYCVVLSQLPDENNRLLIEGFTEIFDIEKLDKKNYKVDYAQGVVYFHPKAVGKVIVVEYYGTGYELLSASRIFTKVDRYGNILETLEELIEGATECLELIKTLGDAVKVINKLEEDVASGNRLHDDLVNDIEVGTPLHEQLDGDIKEASKWKDQLHQDVADGKVLQPLLQQTVNDAEDVKVRLDQSIADAQDDIAIIEATGNKEVLIQSSEWALNGDVYEKQITHTLNSENLHVTAKNSDTKEAVTIGYKIINKTTILLKSDEAVPLSVILSSSYYKPLITTNVDEGEIIRARKGESSLDNKIGKIDENINTLNGQLDNIAENMLLKKYKIRLNDETFDNRPLIMEAIKECVNNGINKLILPNGTIYVNVIKPIYLPSNFELVGTNGTVLKAIKSSYSDCTETDSNLYLKNTIISCGNPLTDNVNIYNTYYENITISNITIDGNCLTKPSNFDSFGAWCRGFGVAFFNVSNLKITNCVIKNTLNTGIMIDKNDKTIIENTIVESCGLYKHHEGSCNGISIVGDSVNTTRKGAIISNCIVKNNGDIGIQYAFSPITINSCNIYNNKTFGIEGDTWYDFTEPFENILGDAIITNNNMYNNGAISITIGQGNNQKIIISNNIIKKSDLALQISQKSGGECIISNNTITDIVASGVQNSIYIKADNVLLTNNIFKKITTNGTFINTTKTTNPYNSSKIIGNIFENVSATQNIFCLNNYSFELMDNTFNISKSCTSKFILLLGDIRVLKIINNYFSNFYGYPLLALYSDLTLKSNLIDISRNVFINVSYSDKLININPTNISTIAIYRCNENIIKNEDNSYKIGRFSDISSTVTIDVFNAHDNIFETSISTWGYNFNFANQPTRKIYLNNLVE